MAGPSISSLCLAPASKTIRGRVRYCQRACIDRFFGGVWCPANEEVPWSATDDVGGADLTDSAVPVQLDLALQEDERLGLPGVNAPGVD
jgi:hypothetical protein